MSLREPEAAGGYVSNKFAFEDSLVDLTAPEPVPEVKPESKRASPRRAAPPSPSPS